MLDGGGDALRHHASGVVAAFHRVLALAGVHEDEVRRSVSRGDDVIRLDRNLRDGGEDRVVPAVTTEMVREEGISRPVPSHQAAVKAPRGSAKRQNTAPATAKAATVTANAAGSAAAAPIPAAAAAPGRSRAVAARILNQPDAHSIA